MGLTAIRRALAGDIRTLLGHGTFVGDISWNVVSLSLLGISGLALNVIIGRYYGPGDLGVFNLVFSLYIFYSQLTSLGIYFSVLKHIAEFSPDPARSHVILTAALLLALGAATVMTAVAYALAGILNPLFSSSKVSMAWICILPGLWCYSMNKVLMAALNGWRRMRAYAFFQGLRYVLMVLFLIGLVAAGAEGVYLPLLVSGAELAVFGLLAGYTMLHFRPVFSRETIAWMNEHARFGLKSFLSGTMAELTSRIDVLMLGLLTTERTVGIYSMAALTAEGLAMLAFAVRDNVNPILTQYLSQGKRERLRELLRRGVRLFSVFMAAAGLAAAAVYPGFIRVLVGDPSFLESWQPFVVILVGLTLASGFLPFNMILVQAGRPALHTLLKAAILATAIALNAALIPLFHMMGAAAATSLLYVAAALYLVYALQRVLGLRVFQSEIGVRP